MYGKYEVQDGKMSSKRFELFAEAASQRISTGHCLSHKNVCPGVGLLSSDLDSGHQACTCVFT